MYCNKGVLGIRKYAHFPRFLETRRGFLTEKEKMYCNKRVFDSPLLLLLLLCNEPPPPAPFSNRPAGSFHTVLCAQNINEIYFLAKDYNRKLVHSIVIRGKCVTNTFENGP